MKTLEVSDQVNEVSRSDVIELFSLLLEVEVQVSHVAVKFNDHVA